MYDCQKDFWEGPEKVLGTLKDVSQQSGQRHIILFLRDYFSIHSAHIDVLDFLFVCFKHSQWNFKNHQTSPVFSFHSLGMKL